MNAKEKAKDILNKYLNPEFTSPIFGVVEDFEHAKEFALIAVDEIINSEQLEYLFSKDEINNMEFTSDSRWINERFIEYWQQVKTEIEKL